MRYLLVLLLIVSSFRLQAQEDYIIDPLPNGRLNYATMPDSVDVVVGIHTLGRRYRIAKKVLLPTDWPDITNKPTTTSWLVNSTNKNFVTDAQQTVLTNTSGTNSGNDATNSQYSGLAASKENTVSAGTALQYYRGDKTWQNYGGYTINVQALTSSPTDGQTIFFGTLPKAPVTAAATSKILIREAGTIVGAEIYCFSGTAGSNESWSISIRRNNTTDFLIATVAASTSERVFSNTSLSIAVVAGDYIEIKSVNPTWGTNPLTTIFGGYIRIK